MAFNVYIDFVGQAEDRTFAKKLQNRLKSIKQRFSITLYTDLSGGIDSVEELENWEERTIAAIDKANVVIPILTSGYLSYVTEPIEAKFEEIINSKNKFLFPIYLKPSDWSSFNWVVKSRLLPSDNIPLSEYSDVETDKLLNDLIRTIHNIIIDYNKKPHLLVEGKAPYEKNKIIFISHDHEDADFAELLKLKLEKHGVSGWIDSERLKIGQDWREEIDEGISNSIAVIAIMTPESRKSEYVTYEWAYAWGKGKKIFPIMLKQTQLHPRLESLQYIDFTNRAARPWDKLIDSIKELI